MTTLFFCFLVEKKNDIAKNITNNIVTRIDIGLVNTINIEQREAKREKTNVSIGAIIYFAISLFDISGSASTYIVL